MWRTFVLSLSLGVVGVMAEDKPVVFSAMGCGPYTPEAEVALTRYIKIENELPSGERSSFMVHCGDIVSAKTVKDWPESQYEKVASILTKGNEIPTFIVPGDNEWNDQVDPDRHWGYWTKHFMRFDEKWTLPGASPIVRQENRSENLAFLIDGVLFIGINKVGGKVHDAVEWNTRHLANAKWIAEQLEQYQSKSRATVIFAQAPAWGNTPVFLKGLKTAATAYKHPILYLHANGHDWIIEQGKWAENITRLQLETIDQEFPPTQVTVTLDPKKPFVFDRRLKAPIWKSKKG